MHRILIVDEDEHLLWALEKNLFPERDDLSVVTASNGEDGMDILQGGDVDLLVSDIKMPGHVDGFQLILRAKEIAPDARVVIMTAFGSGRIESFADRMGITHYIEKPFNISELRDMALDLLDEKEGFQGMLSDLELTDIIQMLCLANRTTLLHLKHKDHRGKIVFERGDLVHAEFDNEQGAEAVYRMMVLRQGDIFMESDVDYSERTIHVGWQDLLLEAVKRADEHRLQEQNNADDAQDGDGTPFASFRPSESAEIDLEKVADEASEASQEGDDSEVDAYGEEEEHTDRLTGDSFFTDEELEEIGMASSEAIDNADVFNHDANSEAEEIASESGPDSDAELEPRPDSEAGLEESSVSEAGLEESSVSEADEAEESDFDDAVAADGGHRLADESSGFEAVEDEDDQVDQIASANELTSGSVVAVLEQFVSDCAQLRITGLAGEGIDAEATFVEAVKAGNHDANAISQKVLDVIGCAERAAGAVNTGTGADEIQLILPDAYVIMRSIDQTGRFHFAVVERNASLGVILVLMRQYADQLAEALEARNT
ncbi:MAG: DUF4388 domain-containing protein [Persicimonas sp.]